MHFRLCLRVHSRKRSRLSPPLRLHILHDLASQQRKQQIAHGQRQRDQGADQIAEREPSRREVGPDERDAAESDPLQGLKVTGAGFHAMATKVASLGLPTVLVQEGGYLSADLGHNLVQFLGGFEAGR